MDTAVMNDHEADQVAVDLMADGTECDSLAATENIMGKFWGSHHETYYFLIRD